MILYDVIYYRYQLSGKGEDVDETNTRGIC